MRSVPQKQTLTKTHQAKWSSLLEWKENISRSIGANSVTLLAIDKNPWTINTWTHLFNVGSSHGGALLPGEAYTQARTNRVLFLQRLILKNTHRHTDTQTMSKLLHPTLTRGVKRVSFGLKRVLQRIRVSRCPPSRVIQNPAEQPPRAPQHFFARVA